MNYIGSKQVSNRVADSSNSSPVSGSHLNYNSRRCDKKRTFFILNIVFHLLLAIGVIFLIITTCVMLNIVFNTPKPFGGTCTTNNNCLTSLGLLCLSNLCDCPASSYFTGSTCEIKLQYNDSCIFSKQCDSSLGLICDLTTKQCNCNTNYSWNGGICIYGTTATTSVSIPS